MGDGFDDTFVEAESRFYQLFAVTGNATARNMQYDGVCRTLVLQGNQPFFDGQYRVSVVRCVVGEQYFLIGVEQYDFGGRRARIDAEVGFLYAGFPSGIMHRRK